MLTMQGSFYHCYVLPFLAGGHAVAFDALYLLKSKEESFYLKSITTRTKNVNKIQKLYEGVLFSTWQSICGKV